MKPFAASQRRLQRTPDLNFNYEIRSYRKNWYYFPLMTYQKKFFFFLYHVFFAVQSESKIRFFAVEPRNTFFFSFFGIT